MFQPKEMMQPCLIHLPCHLFGCAGDQARLYGHPGLLAMAEAVNGPDFTPFSDSLQVRGSRKERRKRLSCSATVAGGHLFSFLSGEGEDERASSATLDQHKPH